jgi:hypothetical protein
VNETGTTTSWERSPIFRWSLRVTIAHRTSRQSTSPIVGVTAIGSVNEPSGPNGVAPLSAPYCPPATQPDPPVAP